MDVAPRAEHPREAEVDVRPGSMTANPKREPSPPRPRTLLLVDDEADILDALASVMQAELGDDNVMLASSGAAALRIMQNRRIGVIITDYRMPGMTGLEFVTKARQIDPDVPAMMMTAYPDPEIIEAAKRDLGISVVLIKPFPVKHMVAVALAILGGTAVPVQTGL